MQHASAFPILVAAIVAAVVTAATAGQSKPDFSGEWILNRAASILSPGADGMQSGTVRIDHREPMFRYAATFSAAGGTPIKYAFELPSDGREVASGPQGARAMGTLRWDADALILTSRIERPGGEMTIVFRYELVDAGRRLRAVERLRGTDHDQDNVWIFDRRE